MRKLGYAILTLALVALSVFITWAMIPAYNLQREEKSDKVRLTYPTIYMEDTVNIQSATEIGVNKTKATRADLVIEQSTAEQQGTLKTRLRGDEVWFRVNFVNDERRGFYGSVLYARVLDPEGLVYAELNETVTFVATSTFSQLVGFVIPDMGKLGTWTAEFFVFAFATTPAIPTIVLASTDVPFLVVSGSWDVYLAILSRGWTIMGGGIAGIAIAALLKRVIDTYGDSLKMKKWTLRVYYAVSAVMTVPIVNYVITYYILTAS